jgi:hypothetical protein
MEKKDQPCFVDYMNNIPSCWCLKPQNYLQHAEHMVKNIGLEPWTRFASWDLLKVENQWIQKE